MLIEGILVGALLGAIVAVVIYALRATCRFVIRQFKRDPASEITDLPQ